MDFEGWLEKGMKENSIRRCLNGHSERIVGLENGEYVLRMALAIEYELPISQLWKLDAKRQWASARIEVERDCCEMHLSKPRLDDIIRRGDRAVLCVWEFGCNSSGENAQEIFERAKRHRQIFAARLRTSEGIASATERRIREILLYDWYIALSNTPLTSAYMYNSDRVERFVIRECDSKLHATSLKKTSVSSEQPKRPMSPAIRRGSEQHTTGTNAYPVTATFTSQQVTGSNPTPSLSPQNGACMTPPNLSASAIVYTSSSHGVSTKLCAPEHSTKAQLVVHSPSNLDPHNESSNQLPVTRTRDPRRRPTVVNESTASFSRTSAVARGTPFELSRTQPSTYVAHDNSGPCISTSTQAYDQSFPEPASKSLQGSAVSTSLPDGRTAKLPSNANPSTAPPAVDLQSHGVQKGTAMPMDDPPRTPERFGQQKPNGTPVGQSNESKPSNASSLSTSKSLVQATSACTGKNSNRPGYADEKVGPTEPCPTIPAKRPRTSDEDDAGGKKVPKLKPLGGLFIPSRRSSASALSLTKQRNPTGVRASKNTTGEPKDITKASKASCSSSSDATTALHAKIRFMEKQLDKDFSRLNRLFNDGDEDEPVTVATLEKKINYLLRNCNATLNTAGSGSSTPCSMDIDPSSTEADSRLKRGNDSSKVHSNWQEAIYELRRRLEEVELEKCHLDEDLKNAREAHSTEERRRCVAEKNRDTLSEHLKFSESLRKDLEDELAQLSKDWELEKQKGLRADEKVASLEKALTNVIADKDETSTQLCGALRERKRLEERLGIAEEASSEGTKKLEVARFEKARVEEQLCIVSSELEAARSSLLMTEEDIKQSNDGRASADKMVSELKGEIANLQQSHIRLTEDLRRAAEESFKASRADLEKAGAELRRVSSEKEEEVAGLQKEISERLSALHLSQSYSLQVGGRLRLTQEVLDKEKRMNQALEQRLSDIQGTVVVQEAMHSVDREKLLMAEARFATAQKAQQQAEANLDFERARRVAAESSMFDIVKVFQSR